MLRASARVMPSAIQMGAATSWMKRVMAGMTRHVRRVPHAQTDNTDTVMLPQPKQLTG